MRTIRALMLAVVGVGALLVPARAEALAITIVPGAFAFRQQFGTTLGPLSQDVLLAGVTAAADYWEGLLLDDWALRIEVGWSNRVSGNTLAAEVDNGVSPFALIAFNTTFAWFADSTPFDASEFADESITFADLGAGLLNTGIKYTGATGDALGGIDLFSVALHEIGHALGLGVVFQFSHGDVPITVTDPLPFAGSEIPYDDGHLDFRVVPLSLMQPFGDVGQRILPSDADILAVAGAGGFTQVRLNNVSQVPEPASGVMMLSGVLLLIGRRRIRRS